LDNQPTGKGRKPAAPTKHKLLVITGTWPPLRCGVGDYTRELCRELAKLPWEVHVLTSRLAGEQVPGVTLHPLAETWSWPVLDQVENCIRELQPDVVNLQWPTAVYGRSLAVNGLAWRLRRAFPGLPLVTTLHELRYFKPWTRLRVLPSLKHSRRIILVDPQDALVVKNLAPNSASRCRVIPIGSNLPPAEGRGFDRAARRRQLGFQARDFVVTFFGFANPPKGLETLLEALRQTQEAAGGVQFLLLSQLEGNYGARLRAAIHDLGLEEITRTVDYAGPRETAERLACADCAVLPFLDGIAWKRGSVMACLAQGLPVISTLPAVPPFEHGGNALLVPARDPGALAAAIGRLRQDPDLRARLGQAGRRLAEKFSWPEIARQQHDTLMEAMAQNLA